jgi:hypothetical protein
MALTKIIPKAGLGVQWRACSQGLLAIANIKRSLVHFKALLVFSPTGIPTVLHPVASPTDDAVSSPAAAPAVPQMAAAASLRPEPDELDIPTPMSTASIFDADDLCSFAQVVSASALSDGGSPAVSDAFLSNLFGEEAQKIFQPFL